MNKVLLESKIKGGRIGFSPFSMTRKSWKYWLDKIQKNKESDKK